MASVKKGKPELRKKSEFSYLYKGIGFCCIWSFWEKGVHLWLHELIAFFIFSAMPVVIIRQRKAWRRRDGVFLYFEVCLRTATQPVFSTHFHTFSKGQCWRNRQPQGRNERFCYHRPCSKRMCAFTFFTHLVSPHSWPTILFLTHRRIYGRVLHQMLVPSYKWDFMHCLPSFLYQCDLHADQFLTSKDCERFN